MPHTLLDTLHRYGCDISQGYYHSKPLPAADLTVWLARQSATGRAALPAPATERALRAVGTTRRR